MLKLVSKLFSANGDWFPSEVNTDNERMRVSQICRTAIRLAEAMLEEAEEDTFKEKGLLERALSWQ